MSKILIFPHFTVWTVEITKLYSHAFLTKISWKHAKVVTKEMISRKKISVWENYTCFHTVHFYLKLIDVDQINLTNFLMGESQKSVTVKKFKELLRFTQFFFKHCCLKKLSLLWCKLSKSFIKNWEWGFGIFEENSHYSILHIQIHDFCSK